MTEILSKMQSNHEKSLFKPLFKVTCTKRRRFEHNIIFCKVIATMFKLQKENSRG